MKPIKRLTNKTYRKTLHKRYGNTVVVLGKFVNSTTPIEHLFLEYGTSWFAAPKNVLNGKTFEGKESKQVKHINYVHSIFQLFGPTVLVRENYVNHLTKIDHFCSECDLTFKEQPIRMLSGNKLCGCVTTKLGTKTHEKYLKDVKYLHGNKVVPLETYVNNKVRLLHTCPEGHKWSAKPDHILRGQGCPECRTAHLIKDHDSYVAELATFCKLTPLEEFVNGNTPLQHVCKGCGDSWKGKPHYLLSKKKGIECKCSPIVNTDQKYKDKIKQVHGARLINIEPFAGSKIPILHECLESFCKHQWKARPNNVMRGSGCPEHRKLGVSNQSREWLDLLETKFGIHTKKEFKVKNSKNGHNFKIDGFSKNFFNLCAEYYGDSFHGNPNVEHPAKILKWLKKTPQELYKLALRKEVYLLKKGYPILFIWETEWLNYKNTNTGTIGTLLVTKKTPPLRGTNQVG